MPLCRAAIYQFMKFAASAKERNRFGRRVRLSHAECEVAVRCYELLPSRRCGSKRRQRRAKSLDRALDCCPKVWGRSKSLVVAQVAAKSQRNACIAAVGHLFGRPAAGFKGPGRECREQVTSILQIFLRSNQRAQMRKNVPLG